MGWALVLAAFVPRWDKENPHGCLVGPGADYTAEMLVQGRELARWMPVAGAVAALALVLAAVGHDDAWTAVTAAGVALALLMKSGGVACLYLLGAVGIGRGPARMLGADTWLQVPLGVAVMLWLDHALGVGGLLSGSTGRLVGWGVVVVGLLALADQVVRGSLHPGRWLSPPPWMALGAPGLAVMLCAACSPPGALWPGEARAYDALSYHLELPKEWLGSGAGGLRPLAHNVYSYLPSAMESAYLHIGAMTGGGSPGGGDFVAGDGTGVIACQVLHAGLGVLTALLIARVVWVLSIGDGRGEWGGIRSVGLCSSIAGACALSVPWVIVVGSLPYNELAMTLMLAGALLGAVRPGLGVWARGGAAGFLVGMACGAKPTAAFLGAPMIGLVLLGMRPRCDWARLVLAGSVGGLAAACPWLIRNWLASGNPVFPFAAGVLGADGWSAEQVGRYGEAHRFVGGTWERVGALFSRERGALHPQWTWLFPLGLAGLGASACSARSRRISALLLIGIGAQVLAWLWLTHLQSRFLMPMLVPLCIGVGLGVCEVGRWWKEGGRDARPTGGLEGGRDARPTGWVAAVACLAPLSLAACSWVLFLGQRAGHPNEWLIAGVPALTGEAYAPEFARASASEREAFLAETDSPAVYTHFTLEQGDALFLLGNSAPLYYLGGAAGTGAIFYHTTWDRSPLGDAVREHPDDPHEWTRAVEAWIAARRGRKPGAGRGRVFVLVDANELTRLSLVDHWYDPSVTPALVERWMKEEGELVRSWPAGKRGTYLFRFTGGRGKGGQ